MANEYKRLDFTKLAGRKRKTVDLKEALNSDRMVKRSQKRFKKNYSNKDELICVKSETLFL